MGHGVLYLSDQCGDGMGKQNLGKWGKKLFFNNFVIKIISFFNLSSCFSLVWFCSVLFVFLVKF